MSDVEDDGVGRWDVVSGEKSDSAPTSTSTAPSRKPPPRRKPPPPPPSRPPPPPPPPAKVVRDPFSGPQKCLLVLLLVVMCLWTLKVGLDPVSRPTLPVEFVGCNGVAVTPTFEANARRFFARDDVHLPCYCEQADGVVGGACVIAVRDDAALDAIVYLRMPNLVGGSTSQFSYVTERNQLGVLKTDDGPLRKCLVECVLRQKRYDDVVK